MIGLMVMLITTNEYDLALVGFYSSSFLSVFFLHLMTRYVSLFGSTVSFASFASFTQSTYKYLLCFYKNNWELNKFLNLKIIILFLLIDLFFG